MEKFYDIEELKVGQANPDPTRHDSIIIYDANSELIHEFEDLAQDPEDPEKITFKARLSDKMGCLMDGVEGWMEKKTVIEAGEMKVWFKEHDKQIAGTAAATILAVTVGSLVIRRKRR